MLWLLNPSIYYSTSKSDATNPIHALKLLTQPLSPTALQQVQSSQKTGVEELPLPAPLLRIVRDAVRRSAEDVLRGGAGTGLKGWSGVVMERM